MTDLDNIMIVSGTFPENFYRFVTEYDVYNPIP